MSADMADDAESSNPPEKDAAASADEAEPTDEAEPSSTPSKPESKGWGSRWWMILLAVLVVEFYVYGRNGEIQVCVGKQGQHDFSLLGQERNDTNRWKFPRCELRENLGLRSNYETLVEEATKGACRGQTLLRNRGEGPACLEQSDGWQRQVDTAFVPPWDSRYYQHLLWFLY